MVDRPWANAEDEDEDGVAVVFAFASAWVAEGRAESDGEAVWPVALVVAREVVAGRVVGAR